MNLNRIFIALALSLACVVSAFAQGREYVVNVNEFTELDVDNNIAVDYFCNADSAGMAVVSHTDHPEWYFFSNNGKGKLTVQTSADCPAGISMPKVRVYSTTLYKVVNSGDSLVKIHDIPMVDEFQAKLIGNGRLVAHGVDAVKVNASIDSGNGQLVISGECESANLRNIGTGTIQADELVAKSVKASVLGTGSIGCDPHGELTVSGMGSGTVYYRTTPKKVKNRGVGVKYKPFE